MAQTPPPPDAAAEEAAGSYSSFVAPLRRLDLVEGERLGLELRLGVLAAMLPDRDVGVALVVAQRLAVLGLMLLAQVAAAGLVALERVVAHELGELEEVRDPAGVLEALVELALGAVD